MKKLYTALGLWLLVAVGVAQDQKGARPTPAAQAVQSNGFTLQVGIPFIGNTTQSSEASSPIDVRFPWDVLYLNNTFTRSAFKVSKGYFGDKIALSWKTSANQDNIEGFELLRREYTLNGDNAFVAISSLSNTATEYEDKYVEGGVLYEYKLVAEGVRPIDMIYTSYATGIGFRSPTAVVTGNISYDGGNPVKDVTVFARANGATVSAGSALLIPAAASAKLNALSKPIENAMTFQAWVKPIAPFADGANNTLRLFKLQETSETFIDTKVHVNTADNLLTLTINDAVYQLKHYMPSGQLNARGDDVMVPITDFNTKFTHLSVAVAQGEVPQLFVNGRRITTDYINQTNEKLIETDVTYTEPYAKVTVPTAVDAILGKNNSSFNTLFVGGNRDFLVDEVRVWNATLNENTIRTDYTRYISGNDARLVAYLRADEKVGAFAYDISRDGFEYNNNHAALWEFTTENTNRVTWAMGEDNIPTTSQLGVLGVTDENGNYEITAIPYSGTGESFTITPMFGNHQFEPGQQLVFLGEGSSVANRIDFIDKSSFSFKGKVVYDTRGVFPSFVNVNSGTSPTPVFNNLTDGDEYISGPGIIDEGYNYYQKGDEKYSKGEYWLNDNGTADDEDDDYLERYARIYSEKVQIYIDGDLVLDENNTPVATDKEGNFEISVPIGNHYITVKKDGHEFEYEGRFPADTSSFKEFFEDANEQVVFVDKTRVTLVGKVVGGTIQAEKTTGLGENAAFVEKSITDAEGKTQTIQASAKNNIGVAKLTLGYKPPSGEVNNETRFSFTTNEASGEYRVAVMPLKYELNQDTGISIESNEAIQLLTGNETVDLRAVFDETTPKFAFAPKDSIIGVPYNAEKSFVYRERPTLKVQSQTSDVAVKIDGVKISTEGFELPVYTQFSPYAVTLQRFERYLNKDGDEEVEDLVPVTDGELIANNNLALAGSEAIMVDEDDPSMLTYSFKAGLPSIFVASKFAKTSTLNYRIDGNDYPVEGYQAKGIILGGQSDGTQTFVTAAPDIPDIILRDPPGTNSYASIEKGQSITFSTEKSFAAAAGGSVVGKISGGVTFEAGGGLAGPVISIENTADLSAGIGFSASSTDGSSLTQTYTFNQTISTSDDPNFVGADGDLYIGNSKNQLYGSYDDVQVTDSLLGDASEAFKLINTQGEEVFISKQKAIYFVEEPSETFFVYSQKYILKDLIPQLEQFIENIDKGLLIGGEDGALTKEQYKEQIRLWRSVILDNEKSKYLAKNNRDKYKESISSTIANYNDNLTNAINSSIDPVGTLLLSKKLNRSNSIRGLLNQNFDDNVSFDAGVGEFTRSVETVVVNERSTEYNITFDQTLELELGVTLNGTGISSTTSSFLQQDINTSLSEAEENTSVISYTLKDNDAANLLSVDVVNSFDGNGPIFITQGGKTSCPYEGAEESEFFSKTQFDSYFASKFGLLQQLEEVKKDIREDNKNNRVVNAVSFGLVVSERRKALEAQKKQLLAQIDDLDLQFSQNIANSSADTKATLSYATQQIEKISLSVEGANDLSNVPEGRNAEFVLKLENLSDIESTDPNFNAYTLVVDNTTNPNNATINIASSGTGVSVPYGAPVYYTLTLGKSISDVYDYEDITIRLESDCDPNHVFSEVQLSARFVPSCTEVQVSAPRENWVFNTNAAYNVDGTTNNLRINLNDFNTDFDSFKKIDLEYRLATAPNWNRLQTYYGSQAFYDDAVANQQTEIALIEDAVLSYNLDIVDLGLQDGEYEIRARSTCTNDTEFISDVIKGRVDLSSPQKFGTPLPIDGILSAGEDLKVSFNEPIFYNSALSNIEIKAETNQLPINHNVSVYFEGDNNTVEINNPRITKGDFTMEFWLKTDATINATLLKQIDGLSIALQGGDMVFTLGDTAVSGTILNDGVFHHYTFTYINDTGVLKIYEDDAEIGSKTGTPDAAFTNNNALVFGGNTFKGNIHDVRLWNKTITLENAYAKMYDVLLGSEANLVGYWPMTEGRGEVANDLARFKHAVVNAAWDIKPKGTSYAFENGQYLTLDNVSFAQLTNEMDATISFWMKTASPQESTLFSNGRGDGTDITQSNGRTNKWAIHMTATGALTFESEGTSYTLTTTSVADDTWHHVTLLLNRIGSLRTYLDGAAVSSHPVEAIGGFSGNTLWLGARGFKDAAGNVTVDNQFTGKLDEFRLWNTLRNTEQIRRDRFNEVDAESIGLLVYARMTEPDPANGDGPRYYHAYSNESVISSKAVLSGGAVAYAADTPPIKPARALIKFQVNRVINGDEMIIEPVVSDWASLEGQVLDITVNRMFDAANNRQQSPITWTAYVNRNEVSWFVDGADEVIDLVKNSGEEKSFEITLMNKGGKGQPYTITNVPNWLRLSKTSGVLQPDSSIQITAAIDAELTPGEYLENLYLNTDFAYDEKLQLNVRVLAEEPNWEIDPSEFDYSMNIVGRIKVDGNFSEDSYDKLAAFYQGEVRGVVDLQYVASYQEYYAYLTVYSNTVFGEQITFTIWDASQGKMLEASIDTKQSTTFKQNAVIGTLGAPSIFENRGALYQEIKMNKGWTWVSFNVEDSNFTAINTLTENMNLQTDDRMLSHSPSQLETYYKDASNAANSSWSGTISSNGGISANKMYKVNFAEQQFLTIKGAPVSIQGWTFPIKTNWNWLAYPLLGSHPVNEALAYFEAEDGDVIKSQNLFAVYDPINGWNGTLTYLQAGQGYMLKSSSDQTFSYPTYLNRSTGGKQKVQNDKVDVPEMDEEFMQYPNTMNAIVQLPEGYNELFVYDDKGVLKGKASTQRVAEKSLSFITMYGDVQERLTFYLGDGFDEKITQKTIEFKSDVVLGTIAEPIVLETLENQILVYPNPFQNEFTVQVDVMEASVANIELYSVNGKLLHSEKFSVNEGQNMLKITPQVSAGIYLIQITMNGNTVSKRVMKK